MPAEDFAGGVLQLDLFRSSIPKKPYCSNDLTTGLVIRSAASALEHRYIQPNHPNSKIYIVFDIDRATCIDEITDEIGLPGPNIFVQNPDNKKAHAFYALETPVHLNTSSSRKAIRFAAAVDCAFGEKLKADADYCGLIAKNPLHDHWRTYAGNSACYSLNEMAEFVDLSKFNDKRRRMPNTGMGRNCNLFDSTRHWSYKAIRQGWPEFDQWLLACQQRVEMYNGRLPAPLPVSEVRSIAKSVAKWTHRNMSEQGFSELQAARGSRKGQKVRDENLQRCLALSEAGWSQRMIAEELGIAQSTIGDWLRASKVTGSHIR